MDKEIEPDQAAVDDMPELLDPQTGEIVDLGDPDAMIEAHERAKDMLGQLSIFKAQLATRLAGLVPGQKQTERYRTARQRIRVEHPGEAWEQTRLKDAYTTYPKFRDEFLRIERIGVKLREYQKLRNESSDDPAFNCFKQMIADANLGPRGTPRIVLEESEPEQQIPTLQEIDELNGLLPF